MNRQKRQNAASILPCIGYGLLCGAITGAAIFLFRLAAKYAEHLSRWIYGFAGRSPVYILPVFVLLALSALFMLCLHKAVPEAKGGGIPRSEGVLRGLLSFRWLKTLLATVAGSLLSYVCGVPVGSEGPAVLIGTSLGGMCSAASKKSGAWNRYVMTGGAGAGFAVATGAPLSAILFSMEELHKRFTPVLLMTVSTSVLGATLVNRVLCSAFAIDFTLLHIPQLSRFELKDTGYLLGLGVLMAIAVALFDYMVALYESFSKKHTRLLGSRTKMILIFVVTGILGFVLHDGIYSGHDVILLASENHYSLWLLLLLFVVRLFMMLLVTGSGVTGGIFIPTLAIGALAAAVSAKLFGMVGMSDQLFAPMVLLGMCAFIGGTLRAPLTAAVLFAELTGQFTDFFYAAVVIFSAGCITELLGQLPFYDTALEKMEQEQNRGKTSMIGHFEMTVDEHSFATGKPVRNILWPSSAIVHSITRANTDLEKLDRDGERRLRAGDKVVIRLRYYDREAVIKQLKDLVGSNVKETTP
ncbi:MAG: chloride channel protein [Oscillospiraceae bacterium]|nr:chloride channel protein [Oscillospiraceae bacterium]